MDRLFQDAAGTIVALNAGDPVGLVKRLAGTADAMQSTALSRPARGRWPKGAKPRNLLKASEDYANIQVWKGGLGAGVNVTLTNGADENGKWLDIKIDGTPITRYITPAYMYVQYGTVPTKVGEYFTMSGVLELRSGLRPPDGVGLRFEMVQSGAAAQYTTQALNAAETGPRSIVITTPPTAEGNTSVRGVLVYDAGPSLSPVDVTYRIRRLQMERGTVATAFQPTDADGVPLAGYGQVRNLANGAQDVFSNSPWPNTYTSVGLVMTKIGTGYEDGVPYCDIRFVGTPTTTFTAAFLNAPVSRVTAGIGSEFCVRMDAKVIAGVLTGSAGIRTSVVEETAALVVTTQTGSVNVANGHEYTHLFASRIGSGSDTEYMRAAVTLSGLTLGEPIDVTVRMKGVMFERGMVETPLQLNYGPNNVTEPDVDDVWFLANDGNDALPVTLPAGTYGIAWVNPAGGISYATQTLAAEGTIDALRGTRMSAVVIRAGDFTQAEKDEIETRWAELVTA